MLFAFLFLAELFVLFLLSRELTKSISYLLYRLTKSKKFAIHGLAFLFFPGTVIHELSHAITASLLGVHVGQIEFIPVIDGDKVKLGSVQIAKTDFLRRFLIGTAPFFAGTALILGLLYVAANNHLFDNTLMVLVIGYVVFEIGNTMFSSRKDMEGALELVLVCLAVLLFLYLVGIRLPASDPQLFFENPTVHAIFEKGCLFLLIPLALDSVVVALLRFIKR